MLGKLKRLLLVQLGHKDPLAVLGQGALGKLLVDLLDQVAHVRLDARIDPTLSNDLGVTQLQQLLFDLGLFDLEILQFQRDALLELLKLLENLGVLRR